MRRGCGTVAFIGVLLAGLPHAGAQESLVVFVFDQPQDAVFRLEDLNRDGDMLDADSAAVAGLPSMEYLLSVDVALALLPGDCDDDAVTGLADFVALGDCLLGRRLPLRGPGRRPRRGLDGHG